MRGSFIAEAIPKTVRETATSQLRAPRSDEKSVHYMNTHKKIYPQLEDYARNALSAKERLLVAEHLANCEVCQEKLAQHESALALLKDASETELQPERRLHLYERLNDERKKRGEQLLKIPEKLLAQVKAKGGAAVEAAQDVAKASGAAAKQTGGRTVNIAKTMRDGAKSVGQTALGAGKKSAHHGKDMVNEAAQTMFDSTRIMTEEVADVVEESLKNPFKAMIAPAKLAGKGIKAGARMAKGSAKIAASGVKGVASAAKGGLDVGAESVKQAGATAKATLDAAESMLEGRNQVAEAMGKGAKKIVAAKPKEEGQEAK